MTNKALWTFLFLSIQINQKPFCKCSFIYPHVPKVNEIVAYGSTYPQPITLSIHIFGFFFCFHLSFNSLQHNALECRHKQELICFRQISAGLCPLVFFFCFRLYCLSGNKTYLLAFPNFHDLHNFCWPTLELENGISASEPSKVTFIRKNEQNVSSDAPLVKVTSSSSDNLLSDNL